MSTSPAAAPVLSVEKYSHPFVLLRADGIDRLRRDIPGACRWRTVEGGVGVGGGGIRSGVVGGIKYQVAFLKLKSRSEF